ncbi:MAG: signal recognition particle-docking protein FtsY [Candidatus Latescibacteria bacterium]|nr:signal recognition particle-docking protein FtsY [Candidatus Latescibacterota bacterium]
MLDLKAKLKRARESLRATFDDVLQRGADAQSLDLDAIEAVLLKADVGVETTERVVRVLEREGGEDARARLRALFLEILTAGNTAHPPAMAKPRALVIVGVNGVGKTTSTAKLARYWKERGQAVILAASDTFRAAATDQLAIWAGRAGVEMIRHKEGGDPGAVAFDACEAAKARGIDVVIADTAGRLHTRVNLMEELAKVQRVCQRALGEDAVETLLVLDANLGQNSLVQAREFARHLKLDGVILTKLDSTAKGGIVVAVKEALGVPIRYVGVGEGIDDFTEFDPETFVDALLG